MKSVEDIERRTVSNARNNTPFSVIGRTCLGREVEHGMGEIRVLIPVPYAGQDEQPRTVTRKEQHIMGSMPMPEINSQPK